MALFRSSRISNMRQSTVTFGVILFAFIVYITVRGQLPSYIALFKSKQHAKVTVTGGASSSGGGSSIADTAKGAAEVAQVALMFA